MELIPMTNFIELMERQIPDELNDSPMRDCDRLFVKRIISYSRFLKQPLKLEMFVPCDEEGNGLDEPEFYREWISELEKGIEHEFDSACMKHYQKAKEKVLFEGFSHSYLKELNRLESDSCGHLFRDFNDYFHSRGFVIIEDLLINTHRLCKNLTLTPSALNQLTIK